MNHIGIKELKTKRLVLRAVRETDYIDMYEYVTKEEVARYVSWSPHKSIEETKALCKMWADGYKYKDKYAWAIVYNNKVIGNIDVVKIVDNNAFLGWQIDSAHWNKGIMTEAAFAVRDYLFNEVGFQAIYAAHITDNIGSGRVMQKIGMKEITHDEYQKAIGKAYKTEIDGMPLPFYALKKSDRPII